MILIFCTDERGGLLFRGRRQSQDRLVRQDMLADGRTLWMNAYTARQFAGHEAGIRVCEAFLEKARAGELCFVENLDVSAYLARTEGLILYRWNRRYPADVYLPVQLRDGTWRKTAKAEFPGFSHDIITKEVYAHEN